MAPSRSGADLGCRRLSGGWAGHAALAPAILLSIAALGFGQQSTDSADAARLQELCAQADLLSSQGLYLEAAQRYRSILAQFPTCQRAGVYLARNEEKAGSLSDALRDYDAAYAIDRGGFWATVALFDKANACLGAGTKSDALATTRLLREQYPDSVYALRALKLEAQVRGESTQEAERLLAQEAKAAQIYEEARALADAKKDSESLTKLHEVQTQYPNSPAALRAQEMEGHILIRTSQRDKALVVFQALVQELAASAPSSQISSRAKTRIAALYHNWQGRARALALYRELMASSDPATAANASVQAAGIEFELLQRDQVRQRPITDAQWDAMRETCAKVLQLPAASLEQRATADLMIVESYSWQKDAQKLLDAGTRFLAAYTAEDVKKQIAVVHQLVGDELFTRSQPEEAIPHYRWIVSAFPDRREFWPRGDNLARTYFMLWRALRRMGAPADEWQDLGETLKTEFADSIYAGIVRNAN